MLATALSSRFGIDNTDSKGAIVEIVGFVASDQVISRARNLFVFAPWFRWRTTLPADLEFFADYESKTQDTTFPRLVVAPNDTTSFVSNRVTLGLRWRTSIGR